MKRMHELNFEQNLSQALQLYLSPKLLQTLRILSLPYTDMVQEIETASEENPFIEIEKHDKLSEYLTYIGGLSSKARKDVDYKDTPGLENIKEVKKSLRTLLLEQLQLINVTDPEKEIVTLLIDEVDMHGYIKNYDEIKVRLKKDKNIPDLTVDNALKLLQTFEPEGVGARSVPECLLIQLKEYGFDSMELQALIESAIVKHFEDLGLGNFDKVAADLGITKEGVQEILQFIKTNLNPYPASSYGEESQTVIPSFSIEKDHNKIRLVNLEEKYGPKVGLSADYQRMLKDKKTDAETVKFLTEKLERAKEMLENLKKRGETSQAIMNIILDVQKDFFEKGAEHLKPLEQKELAERLGLHPSTISRAVSQKFVQTPTGLVPIKLLCPREFRGITSQSIKSKMFDLLSHEDKNKPYNDEEIKDLLSKDGIKVERRTVAAYRKELGILSSGERHSGE